MRGIEYLNDESEDGELPFWMEWGQEINGRTFYTRWTQNGRERLTYAPAKLEVFQELLIPAQVVRVPVISKSIPSSVRWYFTDDPRADRQSERIERAIERWSAR